MAKLTERKRKIIWIEEKISDKLFAMCAGLTILSMAMILTQFFTRGVFPSPRISLFYLGLLLIYSLHKEAVRWLDTHDTQRHGEVFVYSWVALTSFLYSINFLSKDFFSRTPEGVHLESLWDPTMITLQVLGVFLFTRFLKFIKIRFFG